MAGNEKVKAVLSLVVGLMIIAPPLVKGQPGGGPGAREQDPLAVYRASGADEAQLGQIREAAQQFEIGARARAQQVLTLMRDMRQLSLQPDPDQQTVLNKQEEINKAQAEMSTERTKLMLKIRSILKLGQKQELVRLMQQRAGAPVGQAGQAVPGASQMPAPQ